MNSIPKVLKLLKAYHFGKDHAAQVQLAQKISTAFEKFDEMAVAKMLGHFHGSVEDVAKALWSGEWVDVVREQKADIPVPVVRSSGLEWASASNPYGWCTELGPRQGLPVAESVNRVECADHDKPGEWNAYRQGFNLTHAERRDAGSHDFRRRGCSRPEVIGSTALPTGWRPGMPLPKLEESNLRAPKVQWDPIEVANARADEAAEWARRGIA